MLSIDVFMQRNIRMCMSMMHWDAEIGSGSRRFGIKAITWEELEDVYGEDYDTENQTFSGDHHC